MTTRTDIHRPAELDPTDYRFVTEFYQGDDEDIADVYRVENNFWNDAYEAGPVFEGNFATKGTCDHCGAWFLYGVCYRHEPTNELINVGHICANGAFLEGVTKAERKRALADKAKKAAETRRANEATRAEVLAANPGLAEALETDHYITRDIKAKFNGPYPQLTDKQIALLFKLQRQVADKAVEREEQEANATPVIVGNGIEITGKVLSLKWQENHYNYYGGSTLKGLILDDRGFKVWGTIPEALQAADWLVDGEWTRRPGVERGDRVKLTANVTASDDDETFGFFKRPRKAEIIEKGE